MRVECFECGFFCDSILQLGTSGFCTNLNKRASYYESTQGWKLVYHAMDSRICSGYDADSPSHRERNEAILTGFRYPFKFYVMECKCGFRVHVMGWSDMYYPEPDNIRIPCPMCDDELRPFVAGDILKVYRGGSAGPLLPHPEPIVSFEIESELEYDEPEEEEEESEEEADYTEPTLIVKQSRLEL